MALLISKQSSSPCFECNLKTISLAGSILYGLIHSNNMLKALRTKIVDKLSAFDVPQQNSPAFATSYSPQQPAVISTPTELHQTPTHPVPSTASNPQEPAPPVEYFHQPVPQVQYQPLPVQAPQSQDECEPCSICGCPISSGVRLFSIVDIVLCLVFLGTQLGFVSSLINNARRGNSTSSTHALPRGPVTSLVIIAEVIAIVFRIALGCLCLVCGVFRNRRNLCKLWIVCALGHGLVELGFNLYESYYSQRDELWIKFGLVVILGTIYTGYSIWIVVTFIQWLNTEAAAREAAAVQRAYAVVSRPLNMVMNSMRN
ncbi:Transcription elongation factor SPT5 [Orchesella cincta]|uniref:Transcription elongation factor SPT5 n=1 Tax=Orchesella cincta TaxID=48709 RepID=A0A1D2N2F3_ORCCI|nr:Transcription elongation factor SPT5 [Orchesella cincta]